MSLRIVYLSNAKHSHCTEVHVAESLRDLGHVVHMVQEDEQPWPVSDVARAQRADLFLWTRTWSFPEPNHERVLADLRLMESEGVVTASFHLDLLWGLNREHIARAHPFFRTQHVFTADGDHQAEWAAIGVNHHWIRAGVVKRECYRGTPRRRYMAPVVFVGSGANYHPEWQHRQQLLAALRARYGEDFLHIPQDTGGAAVRGRDLNDAYASAAVVVGDSLSFRGADSLYWSDRVYETLGRGGCLVMPRIDALTEELPETMSTFEWGDFDGMCEQVDALLANPTNRWGMAAHAMNQVKRRCTYENRMAEMLHTLGLTDGSGR